MKRSELAINLLSPDLLFARYDDEDEIMGACAQAAHHRLAVNGWVFFEIFRDGRDGRKDQYTIDAMTMAFNNHTGVPIGCAVAFHAWGDFNAGCFVRSEHRREGIGSRLINTLLHMETRPVRIHDGIVGSKDFWKVMGANELDYIRDT